jgi:D-alanyl-D-alanine carboxypeptidase
MIPSRPKPTATSTVRKISTILNSVSDRLTEACSREAVDKTDRHWFCSLAVALSVVISTTIPAHAIPQILVDETTGNVIAETEADALWYPASLTKLMTAYLAFKAIAEGRLTDQTVVVMSDNAASKAPSKLGLPVGHGLTLSHALQITLTRSMNDVATAIGETVAGGTENEFVKLMNVEARRLGMFSTRFANASGLPDNSQVTTARDFALLAVAIGRDFPRFDSYFQIPSLSYGNKTFTNTNSLLKKYPGVSGMKTGFICSSGFNLVNRVTINNHRYISVVMGAGTVKERERLTVNMLGLIKDGSLGYPLRTAPATTKIPVNLKSFGCGKSYSIGKGTPKPSKAAPVDQNSTYTYDFLGEGSF